MIFKNSRRPKRILLGHLNSYGDCLYATAVARQIKADYPGCHLTWAIGSMCRSILDCNPYVDEIWEIPLERIEDLAEVWPQFERAALERKKRHDFDEVFLTQIAPGNLHLYDGTIRSSIFRAYSRPITVPITPVLRLAPTEVENVRRFAESHRLGDKANVILFECSTKSGQSCITLEFALEVARKLVARLSDLCIILSSNVRIHSDNPRIADGSVLSLRENAELTKYCSLLIGGSSGISWIATSDWAKPLPMIQLIKADAVWFASFVQDYKQWGLATDTIIEMDDCSPGTLCRCVEMALSAGFPAAKSRFHQRVSPTFDYYNYYLQSFLSHGKYKKAMRFFISNLQKHGLRRRLIYHYSYNLVQHNAPTVVNLGRYIKAAIGRY
jgi:hypothetical protein